MTIRLLVKAMTVLTGRVLKGSASPVKVASLVTGGNLVVVGGAAAVVVAVVVAAPMASPCLVVRPATASSRTISIRPLSLRLAWFRLLPAPRTSLPRSPRSANSPLVTLR